MIQALRSFSPYDTALLPASGLWTSASGVTVVAGGGRSGDADDNCAAFDTALSSLLSLDLVPTAAGGVYTATVGQALQILTLTTSVTLAAIRTALSSFDLVLLNTGALRITQTSGGILLGTICETPAAAVPLGAGGVYVEMQVRFEAGLATACQIRVSDQYGDMNPAAQGALLALAPADLPYTTLRLGGGVGEDPATWRVADVYFTDGEPAATGLSYRGELLYNDSYLGNTHVEALYATSDGLNQAVGNTPWVPNSGSVVYDRIDEHPPDEDVTYASADQSGQMSTCVYRSPRARPFGMLNCSANAPIYGVQWDGRLRYVSTVGAVEAIVRRIVTGDFAGDVVEAGASLLIDNVAYQYYLTIFDRDPTDSFAPWDFSAFYTSTVVGSREFGVRQP